MISIKVSEISNVFYVSTFLENQQKDIQAVANIKDLKENDFVKFTGTGTITKECVNTLLTGGTNGTFDNSEYTNYLNLVAKQKFDILVANQIGSSNVFNAQNIKNFIEKLREEKGFKCQAIINNFLTGNYEGIISTYNQGLKFDEVELSNDDTLILLGAMMAGVSIAESNTYRVVEEATEITGTVTEEQIENLITQGYLVLSVKRDGKIVIEKDINTLSVQNGKNKVLKENRAVRLLDEISNYVANEFEVKYIGKIANNDAGLSLFKSSIVKYLNNLVEQAVITNFDSKEDIIVQRGEQPESIVSEIKIQPTYTIEKLYLQINL